MSLLDRIRNFLWPDDPPPPPPPVRKNRPPGVIDLYRYMGADDAD